MIMKLKPQIFVHADPELPKEKQEEIKRALQKAASGHIQAAQGPAKAEFVKDFLALFPPERVVELEKEMRRLFDIEKFPKFRVEAISMLFDLFFGGLLSEQGAELAAFFKKHNIRPPE
jgi:hypothetical protein